MVRHSWRTHLKAARSESDVVDVARRFLAEFSAAEISALPRGAWPSRMASAGDVVDESVRLARLHAIYAGEVAALGRIQELLLFFAHAAVAARRLAALGVADCPVPRPSRKRARANAGGSKRRAAPRARPTSAKARQASAGR